MYTRCPSCRSEISFDPPANKDSLPENYRHRIKCPSCGVTIGVKINQNPQILAQPVGRPQLAPPPGSRTAAPRQTTARNNAYSAPRANNYGQPRATGYGQTRTNGYSTQQRTSGYGYGVQRANSSYAEPAAPYAAPTKGKSTAKAAPVSNKKVNTKQKVKADKRADKKSGIGRNLLMMLCSLIFVGLAVVGYLITKGTINLPESFGWVRATSYFDGLSVWESLFKDFEAFKAAFSLLGPVGGFALLVPLLLFTLSAINFIVAFVSAIGKKYGRAFNFIFSFIIGGLAATSLFAPYLQITAALEPLTTETDVIGYLVDLVGNGYYLAIAGAAWGVLQFIFSIIFLKSLKRKDAEPDIRKGGKNSKSNAKKKAGASSKGRR